MAGRKTPTVLITGGAGFIGSWTARECSKRGMHVVIYDNFSVGQVRNLERLAVKADIVQGDVLDAAVLATTFKSFHPRYVIHLAALHHIPYCEAHPQETLSVNVIGTFNVLRNALSSGVRKCVVASSGSIYDDVNEPLSENAHVAPRDVYGLSKVLMEQVALFFARFGLPCVITRLFNVYGPGETNPHVIPTILEQLRQGDTLKLGRVDRIRDYVYVEDVAQILARLLDAPMLGSVVNVGTGKGYSVKDIVTTIERLLGRRITVHVEPSRIRLVDKTHQVADPGRLRSVLGSGPLTELEDGLRKLLVEVKLI